MIANTLLAAGAFASLVAAIPMAQPPFPKRDIVWETQTEVAVTTIPVTVTHWLEPGETPPTDAAVGKQHYGHGGHGHGHGHGGYGQPPAQPETTQTAAPAPPAPSPETPPPAPAPSSYEQPTTQPAPPPAPTTTQAPAPAPTSAAPSAYTPQPQPSPQPAPSSPSTGGSNGLSGMAAAGTSYTGDLTYYAPGLGACGDTSGPSDHIVAISETIFDAYDTGNPNTNPLCGKSVSITGEDGSQYQATIVDRCTGCAEADLDLSPDFFKLVVPTGDGRVPGVKWTFE